MRIKELAEQVGREKERKNTKDKKVCHFQMFETGWTLGNDSIHKFFCVGKALVFSGRVALLSWLHTHTTNLFVLTAA